MASREQICTNYSVKVKVNLILICCECVCACLCTCVVWVCVSRAQTSSGKRKCKQVDPLLAGPQHHTEVSRPPVVLDARYHIDSAWWGIASLLWECGQQEWLRVTPGSITGFLNVSNLYWSVMDIACLGVACLSRLGLSCGCFYLCFGELCADWLNVLFLVLPGILLLSESWSWLH